MHAICTIFLQPIDYLEDRAVYKKRDPLHILADNAKELIETQPFRAEGAIFRLPLSSAATGRQKYSSALHASARGRGTRWAPVGPQRTPAGCGDLWSFPSRGGQCHPGHVESAHCCGREYRVIGPSIVVRAAFNDLRIVAACSFDDCVGGEDHLCMTSESSLSSNCSRASEFVQAFRGREPRAAELLPKSPSRKGHPTALGLLQNGSRDDRCCLATLVPSSGWTRTVPFPDVIEV